MHCLLTALGSYGDVHPMVGLGKVLRQRGHEVTVVANPHFESVVTGAGLEFASISSAEEYDRLTQEPNLWHPRRGMEKIFEFGVTGLLRELYAVLTEHYRPGETVIAAHGLDLASRLVAETHNAPVASIVFAPIALWSDRSPPRFPAGLRGPWVPRWLSRLQFKIGERMMVHRWIGPTLEPFRQELGLPPLAGKFASYWDWYYGVAPPVCLFPEWFAPNPGDWPAETVMAGFPLWDGGEGEPLSPEVEQFLSEGNAPIVFTPGSANRQGEAFFAAAIEACVRLNRRGVFLTKYPEQLPSELPPLIQHFNFVPLSQLLRRSAAFVHHGGIGSSSQGLAAGIPQLIQPMGFDQYDNAMRLRRLGVAEEIVPKRFRGAAVAASLDRLLNDERVTQRATELADRCDGQTALTRASECLEQLVVRPRNN